MFTASDIAFERMLEREIDRVLNGDDKTDGVIRSILSAPDWETILRIKGEIIAYENVQKMMREVAKRMNEPERQYPGAPVPWHRAI